MQEYEVVIGLEVHAALFTKAKIFCGCSTEFGSEPNSQVCPVCLGMPGVLPVLNAKVVEYAMKTALALNCRVNSDNKFDRKNYYYPDLPKNYQISQNYFPVATEGSIDIFLDGRKKQIRINNIHMEEDAGKNLHSEDTGLANASLVDFNRTGVPLLEIVTYPDMQSVEEVERFMTALRDILLYMEVCDCKMEEGSLRFEANVSLKPVGEKRLGQRVEMKNLNSFKMVLKALEYEIERQKRLLGDGKEIIQETRLWNEKEGRTYAMRSKEEAHDYRYFPEPDLVPVVIDEEFMEQLRSSLPELPSAKAERFVRDYGLRSYDAQVLTSSRSLADFYEEVVTRFSDVKVASNWVTGEFLRMLKEKGVSVEGCNVTPEQFAELLGFVKEGKISAASGKDVLEEMFRLGKKPGEVIEEKGLSQISGEEKIREIIVTVVSENPGPVADFRKGKKKVLGYLVGQVMRATKGRANPEVTNRLLMEVLESGGGSES